MQTKERDVQTPAASSVMQRTVNGASILSGAALFLSTLAVVGTGFAIHQISRLKGDISELSNSVKTLTTAPNPANNLGNTPVNSAEGIVSSPPPIITPTPQTAPVARPGETTASGNIQIQPGQFVKPTLNNKGQVQLIAVKRIQDPITKSSSIVNVQFRVRRLAAEIDGVNDSFYAFDTTARHPETSETYRPVDPIQHSTGTLSLYDMRRGASADAYVWLRVPQGVNTLDISIPDTEVFRNVPVAN